MLGHYNHITDHLPSWYTRRDLNCVHLYTLNNNEIFRVVLNMSYSCKLGYCRYWMFYTTSTRFSIICWWTLTQQNYSIFGELETRQKTAQIFFINKSPLNFKLRYKYLGTKNTSIFFEKEQITRLKYSPTQLEVCSSKNFIRWTGSCFSCCWVL